MQAFFSSSPIGQLHRKPRQCDEQHATEDRGTRAPRHTAPAVRAPLAFATDLLPMRAVTFHARQQAGQFGLRELRERAAP